MSSTNSVVPAQVAGCLVMPQKARVEAEKARKSLLVPLLSIVLPLQVARCIVMPQKDCDEVEKARESLSVSSTSVVMPTQVVL